MLTPDVFKGPYSNQMYEPIELRHLNLAYNQIHSLQKDVFEHTPYLEILILEGNQLRVLDQVTQIAIASLTHLQVRKNSWKLTKYRTIVVLGFKFGEQSSS